MKRKLKGLIAIAVTLLLISLAVPACRSDTTSADETEAAAESKPSFFADLASNIFGKRYEVPAGTEIRVRLDHAVNTDVNSSGDTFLATLDQDLVSEGKLLAPRGASVTGLLTEVEGSKRVKGRARLTMELQTLQVDGEEYSLATQPVHYQARGTKKKDAAIIGGGSAVGAVIGALTGGGKGAAVGAGIGAGAGTGVVLSTKGEEVKLAAETPVRFVLAESVQLPEHPESGA